MNEPQQIPLSDFFANIRDQRLQQFSRVFGDSFAFSRGFHVYGDLRVNLTLSAAEDDPTARHFLHILETYTAIANECAKNTGAEILEVQGERLHVLIPGDALSHEVFRKLFTFSTALTTAVFEKIAPAAGEHWGGFSMAADFGPAVLVTSDCGGGSVVSLGTAANVPAKRLGRQPIVQSGHLALKRQVYRSIGTEVGNAEWIEVNVLEPTAAISGFSNPHLNRQLTALAADLLSTPMQRSVIVANAAYLRDPAHSSVAEPIRVQGLCLRADLDGFSAQVDAAFRSGPEAVKRLVARFHQIMGYTREYIQSLGRPAIELPWAGDCATVLLMPRDNESYEEVRHSLPVSAAVRWHDQEGLTRTDQIAWRKVLDSARWAICIAGGNYEEGSNGVMLVANVASSQRTFRVVAGWGPRRANDGYQASGVRADDTVLHNVDYADIDEDEKPVFRELDSRFWVAPLLKLKHAIADKTASLGKSSSLKMPAIVRPIPAPRPHWNDVRSGTEYQ